MKTYVLSLDGADTRWEIAPGGPVTVGRSRDAAVVLADDRVSGLHMVLEATRDGVLVTDDGSTNGTWVDDVRVTSPTLVRPGATIRVGNATLRLEEAAAPTPEAPDAAPIEVRTADFVTAEEVQELDNASFELVALPGERAIPLPVPGATAWDDALCREDPHEVGPYEVIRLLGRGRFASVYEAIDHRTVTRVALKVLRAGPAREASALARFLREQEIVARMDHPNIARALDVDVAKFAQDGAEEWRPYLAMELVEGGSADRLLTRTLQPNVPQALRLAADLFRALAHAHARNVVHRDVKPGNLLLSHRVGRHGFCRGKLSDFGMGKILEAGFVSLTDSDTAGGTLWYLAPEQCGRFRDAPRSADLYAAGATTYRLLTRETHLVLAGAPEEASQMDVLRAIWSSARVPLRERRPDVGKHVAELVDGLVARDETYRSGVTAESLAKAFEGWAPRPGLLKTRGQAP